MADHFIAFWNVENLFDVETAPDRPEYLQKQLAKELKGWNASVLNKKISQLSEIIGLMNNGTGPDILGVCEIENENVLKKLVGALNVAARDYGIAHADAKDKRGIDVAFIYDKKKFKLDKFFHHFVLKRAATRDIVQANLVVKATGRDLIVVGNHWPARSQGKYESEPYRIIAGETLAYFHQRILEEKGEDTAIVAMGDFNDEPFDRSQTDYALSTVSREKVMRSTSAPRFLNLMWPIMGSGEGTYYFQNFPNVLDQFLISKGIAKVGSPFRVRDGSVRIEKFPQMVSSGAYPKAIRFDRPSSKGFNDKGYSDHFPISMALAEKD